MKKLQGDNNEIVRYEIDITFKNDFTTEETIEFLNGAGFIPNIILEVNGSEATILWEMPSYGSPEDIDNELFYILENGELGTYEYFLID